MIEDEKIALTRSDARGIEALLAELDLRVRNPGIYTSEEATRFARHWRMRKEVLSSPSG